LGAKTARAAAEGLNRAFRFDDEIIERKGYDEKRGHIALTDAIF
jgi:hypothetical protein